MNKDLIPPMLAWQTLIFAMIEARASADESYDGPSHHSSSSLLSIWVPMSRSSMVPRSLLSQNPLMSSAPTLLAKASDLADPHDPILPSRDQDVPNANSS